MRKRVDIINLSVDFPVETTAGEVPEVMRALAELGVRQIVDHPPTLEQLLMRHYGDDLAARGAAQQEVRAR